MTLIVILALVLFCAYITAAIISGKYSDRRMSAMQKEIDDLRMDNVLHKEVLTKVFKDFEAIFGNFKKIYLVLEILNLAAPYALKRSMSEIIQAKDTPTPRETNVLILKYLIVEYAETLKSLRNRRDSSEDTESKEKYSKVIEEFEGMTNLLSTVSEDSSDEYISQIFLELFNGMNKIKNV